jgi:hypothetical protein
MPRKLTELPLHRYYNNLHKRNFFKVHYPAVTSDSVLEISPIQLRQINSSLLVEKCEVFCNNGLPQNKTPVHRTAAAQPVALVMFIAASRHL